LTSTKDRPAPASIPPRIAEAELGCRAYVVGRVLAVRAVIASRLAMAGAI
jgi:hypothetical protein